MLKLKMQTMGDCLDMEEKKNLINWRRSIRSPKVLGTAIQLKLV